MSTLAQQPQVNQGGGPVAGQSSPGTGNSLTQISAGPAALAQLMIYEAMAMYAKIIKLQAEQKINMVDAQVKATEAQSNETISEGKAALSAAIYSGIFTGVSAILSFAAYTVCQKRINKGSNEDMKTLKAKTTPMDKLDEALTAKPIDPESEAGKSLDATKMNKLKEDFKAGEYKDAAKNNETKEAVQQLKKEGADPDNEFDYNEWKTTFKNELDRNHKDLQEITMRQNTTANYSQLYSSMINSLGQGASTIATGVGTNAQKQHSAAAALDGTSSQIAGSASSDAGQAMGKATDAQAQEIQILEAIHRANNVN